MKKSDNSLYGQMDIEGKTLPPDFLTYFTPDGWELKIPYEWDDPRLSAFIDRQREIAKEFIRPEERLSFNEMVSRHDVELCL
jgi:hypothetical protein